MPTLTSKEALLRVLEDEGIEYIFGNPGTTELPLMDALVEHPNLHYVLGLQEAVAMAMADGYGRASGKLSLANFHVAPGLGNALGAVYNARFFGSPVIVTAGQREHGFGIFDPTLHGDLVRMAEPFVKWAAEVERTEDLPLVFHRAAKIALTPPTGPVFVSLPGDVLMDEAEVELVRPTRAIVDTAPGEADLARLAERLLAADNPALIACHEVHREGAFAELAEVAELTGAAVFGQTVPSLGVFPTDHPNYLGELGKSTERVREMLSPYDLVFMVGGDGLKTSTYLPGGALPPGMPLLQLSQQDWDLGKNYPAELAVRAGVKITLSHLVPVLHAKRSQAQGAAAAKRSEALHTQNWSHKRDTLFDATEKLRGQQPLRADWLMMELVKALPDDAVIVEEALTSTRNLLRMLPVNAPQRFFGLASGGIGWGLAGAVGVQLALPNRPVVAVVGDGSSMYCNQALWTAAHLKLPITLVICNNGAYSILKERVIRLPQSAAKARDTIIGMDFADPPLDFVKLAGSMGVPAHVVSEADAFVPLLRQGLQAGGPTLLDVRLHDGYRS